jgi:amino acid transporter
MEENQQSIFGLSIDDSNRAHLSEAAKWGRFLAIVGFVVCVLIVLAGLYFAFAFSTLESQFSDFPGSQRSSITSGLGVGMAVVYILFAVIYFFPCLFLLRFSNAMKVALAGNDQGQLTESFKNLKVMFRYVGIITIIIISIYILLFILGGLAAATMG